MTNEEKLSVYKLYWALVDATEVICTYGCTCSICTAMNLADFTFGESFFGIIHGKAIGAK